MPIKENNTENSILILAINYANEPEVLNYAEMLAKQTVSEKIKLIIVINKLSPQSKDNFIEKINEINLDIQVYDPEENLGYLTGVLYGYNNFMQVAINTPKWVVISNTDIIINDRMFFEKLIQKKYKEEIWCIGPSIFSPSKNSYDNPQYIKRNNLKKINRVIWIHERPLIALLYQKLSILKAKTKKSVKQESQYVYSNHGCFFILRVEFVEKIKDMKYEPFLYSEEAFIAEQIIKYKMKSYYESTLEVIHNESSVTGLLGTRKKAQYIANSLKYIRETFYND